MDGIRNFDLERVGRALTKPLFSISTHQFLFNAGNTDPRVYIDTMQL